MGLSVGKFFAWILVLLLLVGLLGFGITDVLVGRNTNTVATVGKTKITSQEFARSFQQDLNSYSQQLGQQLSIGNKNIYRNIDSKKRTILYSVKQGDNLYKIANIFDVNVESILKINELDEFNLIPGQIIQVSIRAF